jgi:hypothetical protein
MSTKIGSIIDGPTGGESASKPDSPSSDGNQGGIAEPENIDFGFEAINPETIRIDSDGNGRDTATGGRRTKSGRVDGRTRAGRAASNGAAPEEGATNINSKEGKISLEKLLLSLHQMGAALLSVKELELDATEAKDLAAGIAEVGKHYALSFDPKKVAIGNLIIVMGGIYGTRYMAYKLRMESERSKGPKIVDIKAERPATATNEAAGPGPAAYKPNGRARPAHEMSPSEIWFESGAVADHNE